MSCPDKGAKMHRRQCGLTLISWLVLLIPLAVMVYAVMRLTPLYINYLKVARTLEQVAADLKGDQGINAERIRLGVSRQLEIEDVNFPSANDFVIRREGKSWVVEAAYEETAPLFANLGLVVSFDKSVRID